MLWGATDPLTRRPDRVLVAGTSGAGKTTVAAELGRLLDIPHVEIDALFHGPGWTPREDFVADVEAFSSGPRWVTEWQYGAVRSLLADRADLVVWLDHSRSRVMRQVLARTVRRRLRREVLWNGNVEQPLRTVLTDQGHIVRWAWTTHETSRRRVLDLARERPSVPIVRLRGRAELRRWLDGVVRPLAERTQNGGSSGCSWSGGLG